MIPLVLLRVDGQICQSRPAPGNDAEGRSQADVRATQCPEKSGLRTNDLVLLLWHCFRPQQFAVKHTPLHPHHPLIATRLIREPELLGQIAPHPNLVRVCECTSSVAAACWQN